MRISRDKRTLNDAVKSSCSGNETRRVHWFSGDSAKTSFELPNGWEPYKVYVDGSLVRDGDTEDYTVTRTAFKQTVVFAVAPANVQVAIDAVRVVK